jgi:hypothetical protein
VHTRSTPRAAPACALALLLAAAPAAAGEPMDLDDPEPRWVSVRFENSPADRPEQLAAAFTQELPGWLEPDARPGRVRVTVAGREVERGYFYRQRLRPGSFSDFVWIFESASGDVVSASLRGVLVRRFDLGPLSPELDTPFAADMSTRATAGFERGRRLFGQLVFPHCASASDDCTLVAARRYDRATGYVNAVGSIEGRAFGISGRSFSALGEAIFTEREQSAGVAASR